MNSFYCTSSATAELMLFKRSNSFSKLFWWTKTFLELKSEQGEGQKEFMEGSGEEKSLLVHSMRLIKKLNAFCKSDAAFNKGYEKRRFNLITKKNQIYFPKLAKFWIIYLGQWSPHGEMIYEFWKGNENESCCWKFKYMHQPSTKVSVKIIEAMGIGAITPSRQM